MLRATGRRITPTEVFQKNAPRFDTQRLITPIAMIPHFNHLPDPPIVNRFLRSIPIQHRCFQLAPFIALGPQHTLWTQRRFCATAAARKPKTKKLPASTIDNFFEGSDRKTLKPTSKWNRAALSLVVLKKKSAALGIGNWNIKKHMHLPSQSVFMDLQLRKDNLQNGKIRDLLVDVPQLMEKHGIFSTAANLQAALKTATPAAAIDMIKKSFGMEKVEEKVEEVLIQFRAAVRQSGATTGIDEKKIDAFALALARLCGLTTGKFNIDHRKYRLQLWGARCGSEADVYIIRSSTEDRVIIFEDKAGKQSMPRNGGHIGQIIGEMLMMKQHNEAAKAGNGSKDVFAIRIMNYHATLFKLVCTDAQLKVYRSRPVGHVPIPLATLYCTHDPEAQLGYSLLQTRERRLAMEGFTAIREVI